MSAVPDAGHAADRSGLAGSVCVVTGAAGGIGTAVCRRLVDDGARVFALDRRPTPLGAHVSIDVGECDSVASAVRQVQESAERIDHLVVAAGVSEEPTPAENMALAVWQRTLEVNLTGAFLACQAVGRVMLEQGAGSIVVVGSMSGNHIVNVPQQQAAYNASKAGVVALTKSLALEWAERGVRVNAVSPGYVDTPLLASKAFLHEQWQRATPVGRFATSAEVAAAVVWLLGDESSFCCGTELLMDGGYSLS